MESLLPMTDKPPNAFTIAVGERVRLAREQAGFSQAELAYRASVHRNTIVNVESGKVELSVSTLVMLALVLGRRLSYFIPLSELRDLPDQPDPPEETWAEEAPILLSDGLDKEAQPELNEAPFEQVVGADIPGYAEWKAENALKLAQVLAWIGAYSTAEREPTDEELAEVRTSLIKAQGVDELTVREIAEEWIRQNVDDRDSD